MAPTLTAERLRERVFYDPETGIFTWKTMPINQQRRIGQVAGCLKRHIGYWRIWIDDEEYLGHRLAWLYMTGAWPTKDIDHRDRNRANNKWDNLREATSSQNAANAPHKRTKKWPFVKGVSFHGNNRRNPFRACIEVSGKSTCLGYHATIEQAAATYMAAAQKSFGEFARLEK